MAVDTRFVVEQFALCSRFAAMGQTKADNSLLPQSYARVQTNYLKQNRKESFSAAYGDVNKSYTFPESLQILASSYIEATLPLNSGGNWVCGSSTSTTSGATATWSIPGVTKRF